jgi:putative lysine transport system substrate-binding protein
MKKISRRGFLMAAGLAAAAALAGCSSASGASSASAAADGDGNPAVLTVAMECAYAPYNWTQPDDSNGAVAIRGASDYAYGYDVMMAQKIADS